MHIALFTQHYRNPDCASVAQHYSLLKHLTPTHDVTLITTGAWRPRRITHEFNWVPPGVRLRTVRAPYANAMGVRERLTAYLAYAVRSFWQGLRMPAPDVLIGVSTPLTTAACTAALARMRGLPWIFEVHDLWPDFPVQMGAIPAPLQPSLYALERRLYRSADHVVTLSSDMERHVRRFRSDTSSITTVPYGTDLDLLDRVTPADLEALDRAHNLAGRRVVLYAGSFGRANALPILIEAAHRLQHRGDCCFAFAGQGYHRATLERAARQLANVRLLPPQPYPRALSLFRRADLSLVPFLDQPVLAANAPSKFYDSLAAGTPVIVTNPGWTKTFIEEHRCGWYAPPEDAAALADRIAYALDHPDEADARGRRGAEVARHHFDRGLQMDRLAGIIERTALSDRATGRQGDRATGRQGDRATGRS